MKTVRNSVYAIQLLFSMFSYGQRDSITVLDEVILTDVRLLHFSEGKVDVLQDSVLDRNGASLTDLLQFNSGIYLKENGLGMVSSPSFRGTNASQTAVVWNGININSQLTGQVDFNTIVPSNYGNVKVRRGGGSVQFGSGAIGGSVHLQDVLRFDSARKHELELGYGSFDTETFDYRTIGGSEKLTLGFGANYRASENDYTYLGTDLKNENGAFENINFNGNLGYKINEKQLLKFYHNTFIGDRDFSGTITAPSNSNYKDFNSRNLLEWNHFKENRVQRLKLGYLYERYKYFENRERDDFSFGQTSTFLTNYDYKIRIKNVVVNAIADYSHTAAEGSSIENAVRNTLATTFLLKHQLADKLIYSINLRKEFVNDYKSPFVYALNLEYASTPKHTFYLSGSKNYRIPTFNEIYWVLGGGSGGNPDIRPESSFQGEIGHLFQFKKLMFKWSAYYIASDDLIQWRPNNSGIWSPININETSNYGFETSLEFSENWGAHQVKWLSGYGFTKAINKSTDEILMYVPKYKITSNLSYEYGPWQLFYQLFFNGSVFTTSDNSDSLPGYSVSNLGLSKNFRIQGKLAIEAKFQINNLYNKNYQNVAFRPMPGRNIQLKLKLNI